MRQKTVLIMILLSLTMNAQAQTRDPDLQSARIKNFFRSLILPGWGQLNEGHYVRAGAFIAAEIGFLTGYKLNYDRGLQQESDYKVYADEHWDFLRWIANGTDPDGDESCNGRFIRTHDMPYRIIDGVPVPYRDHHYYENIGKYPEFICGWDDFNTSYVPPGSWEETPHMVTYVGMRTASNDSYRVSRAALNFLMLNHVLSALEAAAGTSLTSFEGSNFSSFVYIDPNMLQPSIHLEVRF